MIRLFSLSLLFTAAGGAAASACSPVSSGMTTDWSYEDKMGYYSGEVYRNLVDTSDNIVIGKFKYSEKREANRLKISETLKRAQGLKKRKKVDVKFNKVGNDRIHYRLREDKRTRERRERTAESPTKLFYPMLWTPGLDGAHDPGDCRRSLHLLQDREYLVFADKDFKVKTTFLLTEDNKVLKEAFVRLIDIPSASKGITFTLTDVIEGGMPVKLFETSVCSPRPAYKVLGSSEEEKDQKDYQAYPIAIWGENEGRREIDLEIDDYERAYKLGAESGKFKNFPARNKCEVGKKYLSIGKMFYSTSWKKTGQMIEEENGYFDLTETIFENAFSPETITADAAAELMANTEE